MDARSLPPELLTGLSPAVAEFIRALLAENARLRQENAELKARVADLEARLNQNSSNSSRPPSSDAPAVKRAPDRPATGQKRGGQPGHPRHERVRLPPTRVVDHKPARCDGCQRPLAGDDPDPAWRQVWELPRVTPDVTEHRFHILGCRACGTATQAKRPAELPTAGYGPNLQAAVVYLTGSLNASKAQAAEVMAELLGVPLSTGQVCAMEQRAAAALAPAVAELHAALPGCHVNMDETGWKESGRTAWLWVAVTASFTLFRVAFSRGRVVVTDLLGAAYANVLTTDRWSAYTGIERRQVCWAHLRRDFQALIDRGGAAKRIGSPLLSLSDLVFHNWKRIRDGTLTRATAVRRILDWYGPDLRLTLQKGTRSGSAAARALCGDLLGRWDSLWTFCRVEGVEPTNNAAERALRGAVLWRKRSQGTRTAAGSRYVGLVLSAVATCRQQGRAVLDYLADAIAAAQADRPTPSLLPQQA
jgi:transposase